MGITVVAFLVGCAPGLLACEPIPTNHIEFRNAGDCRAELPRMIAFYEDRRRDRPVVMGTCRYHLEEPKRRLHLEEQRKRLLS